MFLTKGLYPFWDDLMTDHRHTDATLSVNRPERAGVVFKTEYPWEGNMSDFFTLLKDDGLFRLYYAGFNFPEACCGGVICYAESKDGLHWEKPFLGIAEMNGSKENNIIIGQNENIAGCFVMKDTNPDCPDSERYKMFAPYTDKAHGKDDELKCFYSSDGIHFKAHHICQTPERYTNMFDSFNNVHYDRRLKKYFCYFRCTHGELTELPEYEQFAKCSRGTRVMTSDDCITWSAGTPLDYMGGEDYELYTSCVMPYMYDDRYLVAFPTRYNERREWNAGFERLTSKEWRKFRMEKGDKRYGLTVTDCVFMSSRDKYRWFRFDEACLTPGYEDGWNWEYGDCYPALGLFETPGRFEGWPNEISMLCEAHHWSDHPVELYRYVFRKDGFASYKATFKPQSLRTVPFTFEGSVMKLNFRTSGRGYIKVRFLDEYNNPIKGFSSCEQFGDSVARIIDFDRPLSELNGREVRLDFPMSDAEVFSFSLE